MLFIVFLYLVYLFLHISGTRRVIALSFPPLHTEEIVGLINRVIKHWRFSVLLQFHHNCEKKNIIFYLVLWKCSSGYKCEGFGSHQKVWIKCTKYFFFLSETVRTRRVRGKEISHKPSACASASGQYVVFSFHVQASGTRSFTSSKKQKAKPIRSLHCFELVRKGNSLAFGLNGCGYWFAAFLHFRNLRLQKVLCSTLKIISPITLVCIRFALVRHCSDCKSTVIQRRSCVQHIQSSFISQQTLRVDSSRFTLLTHQLIGMFCTPLL